MKEYTIQTIEDLLCHIQTAEALLELLSIIRTVPSEPQKGHSLKVDNFSIRDSLRAGSSTLHPKVVKRPGSNFFKPLHLIPSLRRKPSADFDQSQTCMIESTQKTIWRPPLPRHPTSRRKYQSVTEATF